MDSDGRLGCEEFVLAMHLCEQASLGTPPPAALPLELIPPTFRRTPRAGSVSSQGSIQAEQNPASTLPQSECFSWGADSAAKRSNCVFFKKFLISFLVVKPRKLVLFAFNLRWFLEILFYSCSIAYFTSKSRFIAIRNVFGVPLICFMCITNIFSPKLLYLPSRTTIF